jgi:rhodanese-related sulfurtransferase/biotin operon repressor
MSASKGHFKAAIYDQFARIGKAVSSPKRLELLDLLCQRPQSVEELARETGMSIANTSQHLQVLRGARLVEADKQGLHVVYQLADEQVSHFYYTIQNLAEARLAEVEQITRQFLEKRDAMEPVSDQELLRRVRNGEVTVVDVRPLEEYRAGHIPGAVSVPLPDVRKRLSELPREREIVAYCRGPYCVMAIEAVEVLRKKGFRAYRMGHGVTDWRARGWRIEKGLGGGQ